MKKDKRTYKYTSCVLPQKYIVSEAPVFGLLDSPPDLLFTAPLSTTLYCLIECVYVFVEELNL